MKSDKLALVEGKILNLMFFDINIPVVPIEISWRDSYDFEIHHGEEVSISGVLVKT